MQLYVHKNTKCAQDQRLRSAFTLCLKKMSTLNVNNFYKLEPIVTILDKLYAETACVLNSCKIFNLT